MAPFEHPAKAAVGPIHRIAQHVGARGACVQGRLDHGARHLRLGRKLHRLRDRGPRAPRRVLGPALRQIEPAIYQRLAVAAGVGEEHTDLRVLDPTGCS